MVEAEITLARLESQQRTVPATLRGNSDMLRLTKKIKEAQAILAAWLQVELAARS